MDKFDYIMGGIDWGQSAPSVIVIVGVCRRENAIYILDEVYRANLSLDELAEQAKEMVEKYKKLSVLWAHPDHKFYDSWWRVRVRRIPKRQRVVEEVLKIISYMEHKRLWFAPHIKHLIEEMEVLQWKEGKNLEEINKNTKGHAINALCYAFFQISLPSSLPTPEEEKEKKGPEGIGGIDPHPWRH